jgi:hypothetical protein
VANRVTGWSVRSYVWLWEGYGIAYEGGLQVGYGRVTRRVSGMVTGQVYGRGTGRKGGMGSGKGIGEGKG